LYSDVQNHPRLKYATDHGPEDVVASASMDRIIGAVAR